MQQNIIIHGDGACRGNPGIGGWGAIINNNQICQEIYGFDPHTTNNRMELTAIIEALKLLQHRSHIITVYTDSEYVQKGMSIWIKSWKLKAWRNVKNPELWQELDALTTKHTINWKWIRGHSGNLMNERADTLANMAIDEYLQKKKADSLQQELNLEIEPISINENNQTSLENKSKLNNSYTQPSLFD